MNQRVVSVLLVSVLASGQGLTASAQQRPPQQRPTQQQPQQQTPSQPQRDSGHRSSRGGGGGDSLAAGILGVALGATLLNAAGPGPGPGPAPMPPGPIHPPPGVPRYSMVGTLPPGYRPVNVDGMAYYVTPDGTYFRQAPGGYVVTPRPPQRSVVWHAYPPYGTPPAPRVLPVSPVLTPADSPAVQTVWLTNPNGSRSPVALRAAEGGMWIGPKGEYYPSIPTQEQLLPVYGMQPNATQSATVDATEPPPRPAQERVTTTVWIVNANGSRTPVAIQPTDGGRWQGPKGEFYETLPTEDQLRSTYGVAP